MAEKFHQMQSQISRYARLALGVYLCLVAMFVRAADPQDQDAAAKLSCKGKIEQIEQSNVRLKTEEKHSWIIHVPDSAEVKVTGSTTYEYLHPGTVVKFTQAIDDKGNLKDWFKEVLIIETHPTPTLGVFAPKAADHDRPEKKVAAGEYQIRGKVKGIKDTPDGKQLMVVAGQKTIYGYFDDKTEFNVIAAELSLANPGDEIDVTASITSAENAHYNPPQPGRAVAETVKITLGDPIVVEGKKGAKSSPTKPKAKTKSAAMSGN